MLVAFKFSNPTPVIFPNPHCNTVHPPKMSSGKFKELKIYLKALPEFLPVLGSMYKLNRLLNLCSTKIASGSMM